MKLPAPMPPSGIPFLVRVGVLRPMRSPDSFDFSGIMATLGRAPRGLVHAQGGICQPLNSLPALFATEVVSFLLSGRAEAAIASGEEAANKPAAEVARRKLRRVNPFSFVVPS